ncbi:MAG: hypothetical protein NC177_10535 [Ruminococcus flavefaciens]|nr:hypothetical protein [Ruminococcus flavefaciens]
MKNILSNVWTKRITALLSVVYAYFVCRLCYFSIFYDIHITSRVSLCLLTTGVSIIALVAMLYTRKQILTRIVSFIILPAMLPVVILYFGEWGLILPIMITGVSILLFSGAGEGSKTALGTITILLYIFGSLGYFLFTSFFMATAKETVIESGISPSGKYRYSVVNTEDSSNGSTTVYVEPNYADEFYFNEEKPLVTFTLKNMERAVYIERPIAENIDLQWETQSRADITEELNKISDKIAFTVTDEELESFGYTFDSKLNISMTDIDTEDKFAIGKTAHDVDSLPLDELDEEKLAYFGIGRDGERYYVLSPDAELLADHEDTVGNIYFSELSEKEMKQFSVEKSHTIYLNELTDSQLAELGVSEEGDIMTFNGKVCFRFYVAELGDYYDVDSRVLSLDLLT